MSFPKYPKYKDSGVEWLGEVPEHWEAFSLKRQFQIVGGSTPKSESEALWDGDVLWATPSDLSNSDSFYLNDTGRKISAAGLASCGTTLVPPNSIILSTRAPIGSLAIAGTSMCTNQGCKSLVPAPRVNPVYFAYVLSISSTELNIRGKGTTFLELSGGELGDFKTPVPPTAEQALIAAFLDRETSKIDELVAEQRRLIELLKEKRQAVISHAVTKGLNPNLPLKPSGIEWLGDVPEHWDVSRIKYDCQYESGHTPSKSDDKFWIESECHIPWVSLNDTKNIDAHDFIDDTATKISEVGMANSSAHLIDAGAVVFTRDGARVGLSAITTKPMCVSQHIIAWVCGPKVFNHFLLHVIYAMNAEIYRITAGSTIPTIGMPEVKRMTMPLPPYDEQVQIVERLLIERERFTMSIADAERAIELLQERRTALISAAVTGKIDVRSFAPQVSEVS